jgi:hypothetical protein
MATAKPENKEYHTQNVGLGEKSELECVAWRLASLLVPDVLSVSLPRLGAILANACFVDGKDLATQMECLRRDSESFFVTCEGLPGLLLVERRLGLAVVNGILGLDMAVATGPLSQVERGILDGVLATLAGHMARAIRLRPEPPTDGERAPGATALEMAVEVGASRGWVWLCAQPAFFERLLTLDFEERGLRPPHELRFELARTSVPRSELTGASVGDTVVFDETRPVSSSEPWPICVRRGERRIYATLLGDGSIRVACAAALAEASGSVTKVERPVPGKRDQGLSVTNVGPTVTVVAELARIALDQEALRNVLGGRPFGFTRSNAVLLSVAGEPWAEGKLVELEGALAVQITRRLAGSGEGSRTGPRCCPSAETPA